MNFVFTIALLNIFSAIKAKQEFVSSDIASGDSHLIGGSHSSRDSHSREDTHRQELSMEEMTSSDEDTDLDDGNGGDGMKSSIDPDGSVELFHDHNNGLTRREFETRRWHKSCLRKASKLCTKACRRAYKTVCKKRKCKKRAKKALKRECRKSCTKNFEFDRDRAAEEE